ncbi:hypothetical protein IAR55_006464 [Kwoniella newhampshirensis]|uniref:Mitochondrial import inner membrane translocase subunit TIM54 n=1 Tax=Kwoniella newhampshirensis TaxID=1651941 RepID=A0AAW0YT92_9TREE
MSTPTPPPPPSPSPPPLQGNYSASPALPPTPGGKVIPPAPAATTSTPTPNAIPPKPELAPLTGFRSALQHTGIPRSVLLYKPRLPSQRWMIFWSVLGTVSFTYYYDRKECERIRRETIERVQSRGQEPLEGGSLGVPRRVVVWGGKWGGDEDEDRALRYFRKYVKPYLVAAGIDYHLPTSPLHGSITRQIHAQVLSTRRQALGLESPKPHLDLPGVLSPEEVRQKELEGGVVLVGRQSMKEFLEGLRRGWMGGVDSWDWEKEVENKLENDGVFEERVESVNLPVSVDSSETLTEQHLVDPAATTTAPSKPIGGLGFLSRPGAPPSTFSMGMGSDLPNTPATPLIPSHYHVPPSPLPPQPPILLLPFVNHVGFMQIPQMIGSWFNERRRVSAGSQAALALIESRTRPFDPLVDLEFDKGSERFYNKAAKELPKRIETARKDYYEALRPRVEEARKYELGQREMTDEEKKSGKVWRVDELKEERKKKELRWMGNQEGWEIVRPESEPTWDQRWEAWLNVFDLPKNGEGPDK